MDPCGEFPGNSVMCSPLAEADPVGGFPGNAAPDSKKQQKLFLWVILSSPEETHVGN